MLERGCLHISASALLLCAAATASVLLQGATASQDAGKAGPIVHTTHGPVQGVMRDSSIATWWGIPFAEPPLEALRLRSPEPLRRNWTEPLQATTPPPACAQGSIGQEDCLYLNVYAPTATSPEDLKPVMVWIYGGGYVVGDSWEGGMYDGFHLSRRHDVVIVTLNYRVAELGFLALESLRQEDAEGSTGNYGLQDQQMALRWVQENIRSFRGDPGRVTIFGESAGGFSVMWHLVSPTSQGLFHAAIMESGTSSVSWFFQPWENAVAFSDARAAQLGCPKKAGAEEQLRCLRAVPSANLSGTTMPQQMRMARQRDEGLRPPGLPGFHSPAWPVMPFGPAIDGSRKGLADVPIKLVEQGVFNKVPLILGANENGGTIFEPMLPLTVPHTVWPASLAPRDTTEKVMNYFFGENDTRVREIYSDAEFASASFPADSRMSRMIRDLVFLCPARAVAKAWDRAGIPSYLYVFRYDFGELNKYLHLGDFHGGEIPFVFRNLLPLVKMFAPRQQAYNMADIISCKWTAFAYSHDPNGGANESFWPPHCRAVKQRFSDWPRFGSEARFYKLDAQPSVHEIRADNRYPDDVFPRSPKCDLWDELSPDLPWIQEEETQSKIFV